MKILLLTLASVILTISIFSQDTDFYLPPKNYYRYSKISMLKFKKYEAVDMTITSDSLFFTNKYTKANEKLSIDEVNYLRVAIGNQAGMWALYGGLLMGLSCLYAALEISADENRVFKEDAGIIVFAFIAGGAGLGAIIGSAIPKWKTYYVHGYTGFLNSSSLNFYANKDGAGIKLRMTF